MYKSEDLVAYQVILIFFRKIAALFSAFILLSCLISCVTEKLWRNQQRIGQEREEIVANSDQMLFSFDKNLKNPSLCYHYEIDRSFTHKHKGPKFPPYHKGYLIINNLDATSSISNALQVLMKEPFASKITSLSASLMLTKIDEKYYNCIRIHINVKLPFNPNDYSELRNRDQFQYSFTSNTVTADDLHNQGGIGIITLEVPFKKCGEPSGISDVVFDKNLDLSTDSCDWKELITKFNKFKLQLFFINKYEENHYRESIAQKIILTPFALVADIIITPIALITLPIWAPK